MNPIVKKIVGVLLPIASIGLTIVTGKWEEKMLDEKITKKVAEALSKKGS